METVNEIDRQIALTEKRLELASAFELLPA